MRMRMSTQPKFDSTRQLVTCAPAVAACLDGSLPMENSPSWLVSRLQIARRGSRIATSAAFAIFSASATTRSVACALPAPAGLRASESALAWTRCSESSGALAVRRYCRSRHFWKAGYSAAIEAKGSKEGSSST